MAYKKNVGLVSLMIMVTHNVLNSSKNVSFLTKIASEASKVLVQTLILMPETIMDKLL